MAILEGDYVLVRPTEEPVEGAPVVAIEGEDSTVVCGADVLPAGAKLCGQVIGMMRKVKPGMDSADQKDRPAPAP